MTPYYWPEYLQVKKKDKLDPRKFEPKERFDIIDERYYIPSNASDLSLYELITYPYLDISNGSLLNVCSSNEYWDTHCRNDIVLSHNDHCFHSTTFEEVKSSSPYIHATYGLSAKALVELSNVLKLQNGLENHSYVRICPELIFSFSHDMKNIIGELDSSDLEKLASNWQNSVLKRYEVEEPKNVKYFWFGWITIYEHSHYTLEYFNDLLFNIHELIRTCEENDTIFVSVDY